MRLRDRRNDRLLARTTGHRALLVFVTLVLIGACVHNSGLQDQVTQSPNRETVNNTRVCPVEFVVLGIGQDGGAPQIDNPTDPAWLNPELRLLATSGAIIDRRTQRRFLFEATPDIREQLHALDQIYSDAPGPLGLAGVFVTHAHIGHYAGLMFAGHESAGVSGLRVFALPRMRHFLSDSGPWDQLVRFQNIELVPLQSGRRTELGDDLAVTPHLVPHRDEYSETAGFVIHGPTKNILFLPDIDDWDRWQREFSLSIEAMIAAVDVAYLDATFFDDNELPGRDMTQIPHPRLRYSVERFSTLPTEQQRKVRFIHLNHSNPARFTDSAARQWLTHRGFAVARRGERVCLVD